jgi:uncharacterized protein YjbI with pentapeptide repeats
VDLKDSMLRVAQWFPRKSNKLSGQWVGGKYTPKLPGLLFATIISLAFFVVLIALLGLGLAWLSGVRIIPLSRGGITGSQLYDLVRTTVTSATLVAGAFAVVYAYRKQRIDEAASFRADAEQLSKRYQDSATQLGHERAAVRLAGIYAIGRLADDWPENRQMCVDLLCAYLRMPYTPSSSADDEYVVRTTVFDVIRQHLTDPASPTNWCQLDFNFAGGTYDGVQLNDCYFYKHVSFDDAKFTGIERRKDDRNHGWIHFERSVFAGDISFFQATFHGCIVSFDDVKFTSGMVHFGGANFRDFNLFFRRAEFIGTSVYFGGVKMRRDSPKSGYDTLGNVCFDGAKFDGSEVEFRAVKLSGSIDMEFDGVVLRSGKLNLSGIGFGDSGSESDKLPRVTINPDQLVDGVLILSSPMKSRIELLKSSDPSITGGTSGPGNR